MESTVTIDLRQVGRGLEIPLRQIQATVELLDEGNTVPFITRYRKDQTGGLDEEQIREIQGRLAKMRLLADRKQTILRSIESQGKLTEKLAKQILGGHDRQAAGRPVSAVQAEEADAGHAGPLARPGAVGPRNPRGRAELRRPGRPGGRLRQHGPPGAHRGRCACSGAGHILAEQISEQAELRGAAPRGLAATGVLVSSRLPAEEKPQRPRPSGNRSAAVEPPDPKHAAGIRAVARRRHRRREEARLSN